MEMRGMRTAWKAWLLQLVQGAPGLEPGNR